MSRGTRHAELGILRFNQIRFELHLDGGGFWIIDVPSWRKARKLLGQHVIVEGTRAGFNLLNVYWLRSAVPAASTSRQSRAKTFLDASYRLFASIL
jgi:hypothetical protein